jgi:lipoprotein-anchoring transpeptidase ErfK/SrfK
MKGLNPRKWAAVAVFAAGLAAQASRQTVSHRSIVVGIEDRKLALVEDGQVRKIYPVAVGKLSTPSPIGTSPSNAASPILFISTMARPFSPDPAIRWARAGWG